ncbi:MAG: hypothetical protein KGL35_06730 [Bradyrhizobium sp.]|nr:hypothetical protein [Bradyrhizobium sp.]
MAAFPNPPTVVIEVAGYPAGVTINEADFDPAKHKKAGGASVLRLTPKAEPKD